MHGWITGFHSRHLIPLVFLLDRAARQDDRASVRGDVGPSQPRLAQAFLWILIIHLDAGDAFVPPTPGRIKPTRKCFWSQEYIFVFLLTGLAAQPLYACHTNRSLYKCVKHRFHPHLYCQWTFSYISESLRYFRQMQLLSHNFVT